MTLTDLQKKITPLLPLEHEFKLLDGGGSEAKLLSADGLELDIPRFVGERFISKNQQYAYAAYLTHCANHFQQVVEALQSSLDLMKGHRAFMARARQQTTVLLDKEISKAEAALKSAQEVEGLAALG